MAKTKHPIFRLHKIKVHHNRWLIWAIAYVVIVAIAMLGYIKVSEVNFELQMAENQFQPWHKYNDPRGFSLRYPADWVVQADGTGAVSFGVMGNPDEGVSVAVLKPSGENTIRKSLKISQESRVTLDGKTAVKISNDLGNNHFETVVMAVHNQRLYVLRGTDSQLEKLLLTFHLE